MKLATGLSLLCVCLCWISAAIPAGADSPARPPTGDEFVRRLFAEVEAQPADCPQTLGDFEGAAGAACARVTLGWRALKKKVDGLLKKKLPGDYNAAIDWDRERGYRSRHYLASDRSLRVLFDAEARILAVLPGHPCFDLELIEALQVRPVGDERIDNPKRVHYVRPDYPERARIDPTNGRAFVDAVVLRDGSVRHACVIAVDPMGMGFENAALEAVLQWRYEPMRVAGVPVNARLVITLNWTIGPR